MKYRKLGNTGLIVSEVALGTMQFGGKMNMGNLGQEDTTRMVKLALDKGVNFNDVIFQLLGFPGEVRLLDAASDPGVPYPKWMVLQLDTAEDPRSKALYPERYVDGGPWKDLRRTRWSG